MLTRSTPRLSVVIPARNAAGSLAVCLSALRQSAGGEAEVIVVDDGSADATAEVAREAGAIVLRREASGGPAVARNEGVRRASAEVVLFLDADVAIAADGITRVLQAFDADPSLAAVFGSYDGEPSGGTVVSDYRNLLHHWVHQTAREDSRSFWAGCGAVRKSAFLAAGGFDERFGRPCIEDIEFGGRLSAAGQRIRLDRDLQARHLKRWTLGQMILVDVRDRAYPWTRLILRDGRMPNDLNLRPAHRVSAVLVWLAVAAVVSALAGWPGGWAAAVVAAGALGLVAVLNREFYGFVRRRLGVRAALAAFALHALYYGYASATFGWAWIAHLWRRLSGPALGEASCDQTAGTAPRALR